MAPKATAVLSSWRLAPATHTIPATLRSLLRHNPGNVEIVTQAKDEAGSGYIMLKTELPPGEGLGGRGIGGIGGNISLESGAGGTISLGKLLCKCTVLILDGCLHLLSLSCFCVLCSRRPGIPNRRRRCHDKGGVNELEKCRQVSSFDLQYFEASRVSLISQEMAAVQPL